MATQDDPEFGQEESATDVDSAEEVASTSDRRDFLKKTIRRAAYVAPIVLFFKPREAVAGSGGSAITPGP